MYRVGKRFFPKWRPFLFCLIYLRGMAIPYLKRVYSEGMAISLIIIPNRSIERRVFSSGFQPLEVVVNGYIGVDLGVCQGEFFLPGMEFVDPPAVRKNGDQVMMLEGPQVVFTQAGDVEDGLIGTNRPGK